MREGLETGLPMIVAHATLALAAKGQTAANHVRKHVVDADSSGAHFGNQPGLGRTVLGKQIGGQRGRAISQELYHVIPMIKREHG